MEKRTSVFSIAKTRKRVFFAIVMIVGLTVSGLGIKATLDNNGVNATGEMPAVYKLAEINPMYEEYLRDVENGEGGKWTRIPNKYIPVNNETKSRKSADRGGNNDNSSLPTSYNLREDGFETTIKDQGSDGLCWAFSSTTAMESYLRKHGVSSNIELSPKQLDYLRVAGTPVGNYVRDVIGTGEFTLGSGYNFFLAGLVFGATGKAPVKEADFFAKLKANDPDILGSYQSWNDFDNIRRVALNIVNSDIKVPAYTKPMDYSDVISNDVDYLVTDYSAYITDPALINLVKEHVYHDGAVVVDTFAPKGDCYDKTNKTIVDLGAQRCNPTGSMGHAMSIVGWDDTHTYTNPLTGATGTGAFILQNSWGKASLFTDLGLTEDVDAVAEFAKAFGMTDDRITEEWKYNVDRVIENYDPPETLYYAYGFDSQDSDFGLIDKMVENTYDAIFGSVDGTGFKGLTAPKNEYINAITINDETFTFSTGNQAMQIDTIGLNSVLGANLKTDFKIEIDTGEGFKELGTLNFEPNRIGQSTIKLSKPEAVEGDFKLKISFCAYFDGVNCQGNAFYYDANKDGRTDGKNEFDFSHDFAMIVYLNDYKEETPEPEIEIEIEPEPEPEEKEWTLTWLQEQTHTVGNEKDLIIKVDLPISEFKGIKIDNKDVDKGNYTVTSGSTIITIPSKYVDTLKAGEHTLGVDFKTSYIITNFTIKEKSKPASKDTEKEEDKDVPADIPDTSAPEEKQPAKKETVEKNTTKTGNTGASTKISEGVTEAFLFILPIIFATDFFIIKMYRKGQK